MERQRLPEGLHDKAAALNPSDLDSRCNAANELIGLGRLDEAEALHREVLAQDARNAGSLRGLARVARQRGDSQAALEHFRALVKLRPDDLGNRRELAEALRIVDELEESERILNELLAEDPQQERVLIELARCAHRRGDRKAAYHFLKLGEAAKTGDVPGRIMLAREFTARSWPDEAARIFGQIMDDAPNHYDALIGMGNVARRRGDRCAALEFFKSAVAIQPYAYSARIDLAIELRDAGIYAEARACLEGILDETPLHQSAWFQLGHLERISGDRRKAAEAFRKAMEINPYDVRAVLETATEEFHQGNLLNSQALLKRALAIQPDNSDVLFRLGEEARIADNVFQALDLFRRAAKSSHESFWPSLNAARCLATMAREQECFQELDLLVKKWGRPPEYFIVYSEIKRQLGDISGARDIAAEGATEYPSHWGLWRNLAMLDMDLGNRERAKRALDSFSGTTPADLHNFHHAAGYFAFLLRKHGEAKAHFGAALAIRKYETGIHYRVAQSALLELDLETVQVHLRRLRELNKSENLLRGVSGNLSGSFLGNLLMEFQIDEIALNCLIEARNAPPALRVGRIKDIVKSFPDYTAAAMCLMTEMRLQGGFTSLPAEMGQMAKIPHRICQYWDSPDVPPDLLLLADSWTQINPDFEFVRFSKETAKTFLLRNGMADVANALIRAAEPSMQADIFRLAYLFLEGGFYVDSDDRCLAPLSDLADSQWSLVLYQEDIGSIGNNFIGAAPGDPVLGLALRNVTLAVNRGDSDLLWLLSGPGLLTRALGTYISDSSEDSREYLKSINILERHELLARVGIHCFAAYKHTHQHWSRASYRHRKRVSTTAESIF
jgi:tetratricopeptide (TPR) repeat protein